MKTVLLVKAVAACLTVTMFGCGNGKKSSGTETEPAVSTGQRNSSSDTVESDSTASPSKALQLFVSNLSAGLSEHLPKAEVVAVLKDVGSKTTGLRLSDTSDTAQVASGAAAAVKSFEERDMSELAKVAASAALKTAHSMGIPSTEFALGILNAVNESNPGVSAAGAFLASVAMGLEPKARGVVAQQLSPSGDFKKAAQALLSGSAAEGGGAAIRNAALNVCARLHLNAPGGYDEPKGKREASSLPKNLDGSDRIQEHVATGAGEDIEGVLTPKRNRSCDLTLP